MKRNKSWTAWTPGVAQIGLMAPSGGVGVHSVQIASHKEMGRAFIPRASYGASNRQEAEKIARERFGSDVRVTKYRNGGPLRHMWECDFVKGSR